MRQSSQTDLIVPASLIFAWSDHSGIDPDQIRRSVPSRWNYEVSAHGKARCTICGMSFELDDNATALRS